MYSKIDMIRINAWSVKVRNGASIEQVPEQYRDAVREMLGKQAF